MASSMQEFECKICQNTKGNMPYKVKEMMFGIQQVFDYIKCANCGCLQIQNIPKNISDYYPKEQYYSFSTSTLSPIKQHLKHYTLGKLFNYYIGYFSIVGYIASRFYYLQKRYEWVKCLSGLSKSASILDIGSGSGKYLDELLTCGFKNIKGIDPYIENNIITAKGVPISKQELSAINGAYDFIMLNHVFEHMDHPQEILSKLNSLLTPTGKLLIRIPLVDSFAWDTYGVNWYQIDAPRHFYLYTKKSIKLLAQKTGFKIEQIIFDSNDYQFIFSEQYVQHKTMKAAQLFKKEQINKWRNQANKLNDTARGDQACFILTRNTNYE
jgi:2-polyprenyl-3-methyl-5-hydroxy-6-metoxy-1,4-benzoquinol methylase